MVRHLGKWETFLQTKKVVTIPETTSSPMKISIFTGKYHQKWWIFQPSMSVYQRVTPPGNGSSIAHLLRVRKMLGSEDMVIALRRVFFWRILTKNTQKTNRNHTFHDFFQLFAAGWWQCKDHRKF